MQLLFAGRLIQHVGVVQTPHDCCVFADRDRIGLDLLGFPGS